MSSATEDSSLGVAEGQDVTRSVKVFGSLGGICKGATGKCTIVSRDAGSGAVCVVD